jgi:hypothetical protein
LKSAVCKSKGFNQMMQEKGGKYESLKGEWIPRNPAFMQL